MDKRFTGTTKCKVNKSRIPAIANRLRMSTENREDLPATAKHFTAYGEADLIDKCAAVVAAVGC
jgi:hypothetical protein